MADHTADGGYFMGPQAPESDAERWARETMARPVMSLAAATEEYRRSTERPEWFHLPGRSIRVGAIKHIVWDIPDVIGSWVCFGGDQDDIRLTPEQAAELKRLVGAP